MFNFKYIKDKATPGSWRRGYEYLLKKQVLESSFEGNTVSAKVKGNYQDHYSIELDFSEEEIKAKCDCPLEEEWCKHAVSVGLVAIEKHYYEEFLTQTTGQVFEFPDENIKEPESYDGGYKFLINTDYNQKFAGIKIVERKTNEEVKDIKKLLQSVIEMQKLIEGFEFNKAQKVEFSIMQHLYKNSVYHDNTGYHSVPFQKFNETLTLLGHAEEVIDSKTSKRLEFRKEEWKLVLTANVSMVGNVLLSLHWHRPDMDEVLPFEEVKYFSRQLKWGRYKNIVFPIDTLISVLPHYLTKSTFTDIRDADGGKFVYEELPKLKKLMTVDIAEYLDELELAKIKPVNVLTLSYDEEDEEAAVKVMLEFEYEGCRVSYGKLANKTPYVTVKKPKKDIIYWIKRNLKFEENAFKILQKQKFLPMQTNNLSAKLDDGIDFYNEFVPNLNDAWKIIEDENVTKLKTASEKLKIHAKLDFDETVDSFTVEMSCAVGETIISLDMVQQYLQQGKKYFYLENEGYVEVPLMSILTITKTLQNYDAIKLEERVFRVKTYRAGLIAEFEEQEVVLDMSPKFDKFWSQIKTFSTLEDVKTPKGIKADLREYQSKGLGWLWFLYSFGLNGILADDMGLGKTLQVLSLIQKAKEEEGKGTTLVVCPTSVVFNWESEVEKFAKGLKCLNLTGSTRKDSFKHIMDYDIVVTSYALIRRDIDVLKKHNFRMIILDESQNIKNYGSLTAQSSKLLKSSHRFALSGTPIENRISELWSVFDFLMPGFLYDLDEFNYRFGIPIEDRGDRHAEQQLKKTVYPFILRRLKRDVAKDLPEKSENVAYCKMTPDQKDLYLEVLDSTKEEIFKNIADKGLEKSRLSIFTALLRLRQICNHPRLYDKEGIKNIKESGKFEHLKEMLEEIISEGHRILLFSQFVGMLDIIKEWFIEKGIKYEYLTGETKDRKGAVDRFNNDESIPVFLISLKAGGTGLNLTSADYVIHYDPWWNPAVEDQATDRAHRIGQTKKVFVYRFITKGSVEEKIMKLKERKRNLVDSVISVDRAIAKLLSYEDLKDIFSPDL